jgi:dTDP-3-amino-3,4,6-trideoxy-alpha-D-glucose transaminase
MKSLSVRFFDLSRESARNRSELEQAIARVLASGRYILGPELEALEKEFAAAACAAPGVSFAAGVASGTDALALAIEASGALIPGAGEEVITTALTAGFTALAICRAGAIPRFVDVDPVTLQIDISRIKSCISRKTRILLPVHLYGHACDINPILDLANEHGLIVIEDACQAHGARLDGKALGAFGRAAAFSFYPTKNLGALGDAGMVLSRDPDLIQRVKQLRHGGQDRLYNHELLGYCSRLDEIQAAVLRLKLITLEKQNSIRRMLAARYDEAFADLNLTLLPVNPNLVPNRHLYPIRTPRREALRSFLQERGIETLIHYPIPLPLQPAFQRFVLPGQEFPVAQKVTGEMLSLPLYPELTEEELQYTIDAVRQFFGA